VDEWNLSKIKLIIIVYLYENFAKKNLPYAYLVYFMMMKTKIFMIEDEPQVPINS
jgi:hypothetical protein